MELKCTCGKIMVGGKETASRNWNPDCPEHGTKSEWWSSPKEIARRQADSERLRELQARAKAARQAQK